MCETRVELGNPESWATPIHTNDSAAILNWHGLLNSHSTDECDLNPIATWHLAFLKKGFCDSCWPNGWSVESTPCLARRGPISYYYQLKKKFNYPTLILSPYVYSLYTNLIHMHALFLISSTTSDISSESYWGSGKRQLISWEHTMSYILASLHLQYQWWSNVIHMHSVGLCLAQKL